MGLSSTQKMKILTLSILLLIMALFSAQSHAASFDMKIQLIERLQDWQEEINSRQDLELREKDLEIQFISRLIFQVESKYREQSWPSFFQKALLDMQETDDLGPFLESLSESLSTLLEKNEDALSFLQAYLDFSSVLTPATPGEFAETRSYFDGRKMLQAKAMNRDEAAEYVDARERAAAEYKSPWTPVKSNLVEEYREFQSQEAESQTSDSKPESSESMPEITPPQLLQSTEI